MAPDDDPPEPKPDPKVKELLGRPLEEVVDEVTAAELQRWFGLPSFAELEEAGVPVPPSAEDPDVIAVREQRAKVLAEIDPALLDAIDARTVTGPRSLLKFQARLDVHVDPNIARLDIAMIEGKVLSAAEPRELERPEDLEDELKDVAPQALLRDLHRSEELFDKRFEVIDMAAEQKVDGAAIVAEAMRTNWKLPPLEVQAVAMRRMVAEVRRELVLPWRTLPSRVSLPNRRVTE